MIASEEVDVVLSYVGADRQRVDVLQEKLREAGIRLWLDQDHLPGPSKCNAEFVQAIQRAKVLVFICSKVSLSSPDVRNEIMNNWELGSRCCLPIWIEPPSEIPAEVAYWLGGSQWIETWSIPPLEWTPRVLTALKAYGVPLRRPVASEGKELCHHVDEPTRPAATARTDTDSASDVGRDVGRDSASRTAPPDSRERRFMTSPEVARIEQNRWIQELQLPPHFVEGVQFAGLQFCLIPPGRFHLGACADDQWAEQDEKPAIPLEIRHPLFMMQFPLTCGDLRRHLSTLAVNQRWMQWDRSHQGLSPSCPAAELGLLHLQEYCDVLCRETGLRLRLPTEAEWEYSARAGAAGRFWWGDEFEKEKSVSGVRQPVESSAHRKNAWGLIDVLGNVAEWTSSAYGPLHSRFPQQDAPSSGVESRYRVIRGGSFREQRPTGLRLSRRQRVAADSSARFLGARLVTDASELLRVVGEAAKSEKGPS